MPWLALLNSRLPRPARASAQAPLVPHQLQEEPSARARFRSLQQMIPRRTHPLLICLYELRARIAIGRAGCSIIDKSKLEVEQIDSGEVGLDNPPIRAADELLLDEGDE